jgi:hypothetical protein
VRVTGPGAEASGVDLLAAPWLHRPSGGLGKAHSVLHASARPGAALSGSKQGRCAQRLRGWPPSPLTIRTPCRPLGVRALSCADIDQPPRGGPEGISGARLRAAVLILSGLGGRAVSARPAWSPPGLAACSRGKNADARCCTTRRLSAHRTTERTLLYPWHPWSGLSVRVHEVSEGGGATALRCSLGGDGGRHLEVPAWMFEREACVPLVVASRPRVDVGALSALHRLLTDAAAAARDSPDQNRGEAHATPPRPPPGDAGEPSSAVRPLRPASRGGRPGSGGLVGAAAGDPAGADRLGGAAAAAARRERAERRRPPP